MANFNFNKAIIGGRLTADPELRSTTSGVSVCRFSVAVRRKGKADGTDPVSDFINCTAWRQSAEFVSKYFKKGSSICVVGSIQTSSSTDQSGQKRYFTEVVADEINFVDAKGESAQAESFTAPAQKQAPATYNPYSVQEVPNFEPSYGDDLPF